MTVLDASDPDTAMDLTIVVSSPTMTGPLTSRESANLRLSHQSATAPPVTITLPSHVDTTPVSAPDHVDTKVATKVATVPSQIDTVSVTTSSQVDATSARWSSQFLKPNAGRLIAWADAATLIIAAAVIPGERAILWLFAVLGFVMLRCAGLQRDRLTLSVLDDFPMLSAILLADTGLITSVGVLLTHDDALRTELPWLIGASAALVLQRMVSYSVVSAVRRSGLVSHPTLVIGCGRVGAQLTNALLDNPQYGLRPIGFLDDRPFLPIESRPVPLLSGTDRLAAVIAEHNVHNVIVAFSARSETDMIDILRTCDRVGVEIFTVPRLFEMHSSSRGSDTVRGLPLIRLRRPAFRSGNWRLKRLLDITIALLAMAVLSPVFLACALVVRLELGRGILFKQKRVGIDGSEFELLKFKSLRPVDESESATKWNVSHDDRIGPAARMLRKLSLDELPQLWNIVRGDMSLVGPRPERPHFVDQFSLQHREYLHRHRVPCGLTGWAQVNGLRGDTSIGERARFDNYYIENWSLWLDLKIMLRTVSQVIRMAGG